MNNKLCSRCSSVKPINEFRADVRYKDGFTSWCYACHRQRNSEWARENKARLAKKAHAWRQLNPDKHQASDAKYKKANLEKLSAANRKWSSENLDKRRQSTAKRKALKLAATPKWACTKEIQKIYKEAVSIQKETGIEMHVDHIVPLQSSFVCGLHCQNNLQIITASENASKKNIWWPDMPSEAYRQPRLFADPPPKPVQAGFDL